MFSELINKTFQVTKKLGSGGCAEIFEGVNILTKEKVAIKVEKKNDQHSHLKNEANIYEYLLNQTEVPPFIPKTYQYFSNEENNFLVMDLLGPSLSDLFKRCGKSFSLKTVLMIALLNLRILEFVHSKDLVHRDIKPNNFLIGKGDKCNQLYLIDFGYSKKYRLENGSHIPLKIYSHLTGTTRYASINNHLCLEQSRRDDLETLGYSWIYLLKGGLPWQGLKAPKNVKNQKVKEKKMVVPVDELCYGIPTEFETYINYCRKLEFEEAPDYMYLKSLFQKLFDEKSFLFDYKFSWNS